MHRVPHNHEPVIASDPLQQMQSHQFNLHMHLVSSSIPFLDQRAQQEASPDILGYLLYLSYLCYLSHVGGVVCCPSFDVAVPMEASERDDARGCRHDQVLGTQSGNVPKANLTRLTSHFYCILLLRSCKYSCVT